jgi:glycosyltransferase involved in cell wall biosynthesis
MRVVTLVWDSFHARNTALGHALGGPAVHIRTLPNLWWLLPLRYLLDGIATWRLLEIRRPDVVLAGTPPVFAVLVAWLWCRRRSCRLIVDSHTGAFRGWKWGWSRAFHRALAPRASAVLVHTEEDERLLREWGARVLLLPDDLPDVSQANAATLGSRPRVVVAGSLDSKEPVAAVVRAAELTPDVEFRLTGDFHRLPAGLRAGAPDNVQFTGWLEYRAFLGELVAADAVAVFSTDPRIMNRAAFEAVGLGRPLVLSDLPGLRTRFGTAALFSANEPEAMARTVRQALVERDRLAMLSAQLRPRLEGQHKRALGALKQILGVTA